MSKSLTGRNFTISIKPYHKREQIDRILSELKGVAIVWAIIHDRDTTETGELVEKHTHYLLEYDTPRKLTTIANLFGVEPNFVEIVKSKKAMLRYLTHKDDEDKFQYKDFDVMTNSPISYEDAVMGGSMSNAEVLRFIREGRAEELIDVIPLGRLRMLQQIAQYDRQGDIYKEIRLVKEQMNIMTDSLFKIKEIAEDFQLGFTKGATQLLKPLQEIAELAKTTLKKQIK